MDVRQKIPEHPPKPTPSLLGPMDSTTDSAPRRVKRRAPSDIEPAIPLRLLGGLQDDAIKVGESTTLCVTYSSSVPPDFKFFRNGKQIINLPGFYTIKKDGGRLICRIENASVEDAGEWTLVAETPNSTIQTKCQITVKEPPKPTKGEKSIKPMESEQIESALPAITRIRQRLDSETDTASSPTKRARKEEDEETGEPPHFHHSLLEDLTAKEGESVVLSVTSTTIPNPTVQWYRNGVLIERSNSNYIIKSDQGRFECTILSCTFIVVDFFLSSTHPTSLIFSLRFKTRRCRMESSWRNSLWHM